MFFTLRPNYFTASRSFPSVSHWFFPLDLNYMVTGMRISCVFSALVHIKRESTHAVSIILFFFNYIRTNEQAAHLIVITAAHEYLRHQRSHRFMSFELWPMNLELISHLCIHTSIYRQETNSWWWLVIIIMSSSLVGCSIFHIFRQFLHFFVHLDVQLFLYLVYVAPSSSLFFYLVVYCQVIGRL